MDSAILKDSVLRGSLAEKPVIIIGEVPYLIEGSNAVMFSFQAAWDLHLNDANVMVMLPGSGIWMMENEVPGYKSPLYGRRTGQIKVEPLTFTHVTETFYYLLVEKPQRTQRAQRKAATLCALCVLCG